MSIPITLSNILVINNPQEYKTHFATWNGRSQPLDVFVRNKNEWLEWNAYKGQKNDFNRKYVFSLADVYSEPNVWLFGGIFEVFGIENDNYKVRLTDQGAEYIGRLKVHHKLSGRNRRIRLESCYADLTVSAILKEVYSGESFVGYESINLTYSQLEIIISNSRPDWRAALASIKGIYLITDVKTGKRYIGSAYGEGGVWSRWESYIHTLHGSNDQLIKLIDSEGKQYARENFRFTLLEYRPVKVANEVLIERESFWKQALLTRGDFGYNSN